MNESTWLAELIARARPVDEAARAAALVRHDRLTKPPGSLGRLEELGAWLAAVQGRVPPSLGGAAVVVAAADHGVAAAGVSAYPQEVTQQMVLNFARGGAAVCAMARAAGARLVVVDAGVRGGPLRLPGVRDAWAGDGTADFRRGPAMTEEQLRACLAAGAGIALDLAAAGADVFIPGEMGIGNTTAAAAVTSAATGASPDLTVGRGTGVSDERLAVKRAAVEQALAVNAVRPDDGQEILRRLGGFELAVLAGVMLGAAAERRAVVLDGYISTAAALAAVRIAPALRGYLVAGHRSAEPGHALALDDLGLAPLLQLDMRLGEGTGGLAALPLLRAAAAVLGEMATFDEAGVSDSDEVVRDER